MESYETSKAGQPDVAINQACGKAMGSGRLKSHRRALAPRKLFSVSTGILLLSFLPAILSAQTQDWRKQLKSDTTLGTVRRLFLNQKVIVGGVVVEPRGGVLLEWEQALSLIHI